jgi:phosphoserine phosphatase RsbU/P
MPAPAAPTPSSGACRLTVLVDDPVAAAALIDPLCAAWPDGPPPLVHTAPAALAMTADRFNHLVEACDVLLVLPASVGSAQPIDAQPIDLAGLVAARMLSTPGIAVLLADAAGRARLPEADNLLCLPEDAPPAIIAGAVFAAAQASRAARRREQQSRVDARVMAAAERQIEAFQTEIQLAAMVQREFLPRALPAIPGLQFGVLFRPGSALSGDFYDLQRLDEHHVGLFLADACGHGVAAALLMMLVSRLLPTKDISGSTFRIVPPGEALTRLNAAFCTRRGELGATVSAVYAVVDLRDGRVQLATAGHPPPIIAGPAGGRVIDDGGPPLGVLDDLDYSTTDVDLHAGESLLMISDGFEHAVIDHGTGVTVVPGQPPPPAIMRLTALAAAAPGGLDSALDALTAELDSGPGSLHQPDDITLLAVRRLPPALAQRPAA